jgi:hypothetical protein
MVPGMTPRTVSQVIVEPKAGLLVVLQGDGLKPYEYIYREANGLRWNNERRAVHAYEPSRWEHAELLRHVAHTVREAFGEELLLSPSTEWVGISPELKAELCEVLSQQ